MYNYCLVLSLEGVFDTPYPSQETVDMGSIVGTHKASNFLVSSEVASLNDLLYR
jgi:hypothetical protein